jgi:iron complex outermembrane receptor protein
MHRPLFLSSLLLLSATPAIAQVATDPPSDGRGDAPSPAPAAPGAPPPAAGNAPAMQEVFVTGSKIRGSAPVGSPLIYLGRDDINNSASLTPVQLLQELPQILDYGVSENSRSNTAGGGNTTYNSAINLRGLGPFATLTLVDGHRTVPVGIGGNSIDPSMVPSLMLQRIDVEADGASALYGSDAVAGVVNLILRRNVKGAEAHVSYGSADGYDERQAGFVYGKKWDGGQFTVGLENSYHSALNAQDRDFYGSDLRARGGPDSRVVQCSPGNITTGGVSYAIPAGGVTPASSTLLVANTVNRCDNIKNTDFFPRQNHNNLAFTMDQELSDKVTLHAEGFGHRRDYLIRGLPAQATLTVPSSNAFFVAPPGTSPVSETVAYAFSREYGTTRVNEGYSAMWQLNVGLDVELPQQWKLATNLSHGQDEDRASGYPGFTGLNPQALAAALASSNPATALNVFGGTTAPAVLQAIHDLQTNSVGSSSRDVFEAQVDGPVATLPGGDLRAAMGFEVYQDKLATGVDNITATSYSSSRKYPSRTVKAAYAEVLVPIFGRGNSQAGLRKLDLDIAVRSEKYSDIGSTTNPKVGIEWSPAAGLSLRGSYGESFRAPVLSQITPTNSGLFVNNYPDPASPTGVTTGLTITGAKPGLKSETATSRTLGLDFTPGSVPGLDVSLTYFSSEYRDQITSFASNFSVLQNPAIFAAIITRNPSQALIDTLLQTQAFTGILPPVVGVVVDGRNSNLSITRANGLDYTASYRWKTPGYGTVTARLAGTEYLKFDQALTPTAPYISQLNNINFPVRRRLRLGLNWKDGAVSAAVDVNHTGAYSNNLATPVQRVDAYTTLDLRAAYDFGAGAPDWLRSTTLSISAKNLLNKEPPFVNLAALTFGGGGGFDSQLASPVGRLIALNLNKRW